MTDSVSRKATQDAVTSEPMLDDVELLRHYAEEKSEESFAELVRRHLDLVYAVALRKVGGDTHLAEDVAQQVFTALAAKAPALCRHPALTGWLFTSTHYAATQLVRTESRRRVREQKAQAMNEFLNDSGPVTDWERLRPVLDDLIRELGERDREAVLLRYFEGRPLAEVGARLRLSEDGARSRVDRALGKLHAALARRGVTSTAAALGVALANQAGAAAPAGLAATVTGAALAGAVGGGGATAWLVFLTMNKIKTGIAVAVLLAALVPVLVELRANQTLSTELKDLQAGGAEVQTENTRLLATLAKVGAKSAVPNESGDLAKLRARAALLRKRPEGVVEAEMRAPTNAGFATAEAAFETMNWAAVNGDWETLAKTWAFAGETKATADAFFAGLSPAAREKYGTPERALAHGLLTSSSMLSRNGWMTAMQVYDTHLVDGPASMQVAIWQRQGNGNEFANVGIFERASADRWVAVQPAVARILSQLIPRLDPVSGEPMPNQK